MNPVLRNVIAVIAGILFGAFVNSAIVSTGHMMFPLEGLTDPNDMEALKVAMLNAEPKHFLFPFLAHALGTFTGAILAAAIGISRKKTLSLIVGGCFLIGGVAVNIMIPGPMWFSAADILLAYIPMAWLGWKLIDVRDKNLQNRKIIE